MNSWGYPYQHYKLLVAAPPPSTVQLHPLLFSTVDLVSLVFMVTVFMPCWAWSFAVYILEFEVYCSLNLKEYCCSSEWELICIPVYFSAHFCHFRVASLPRMAPALCKSVVGYFHTVHVHRHNFSTTSSPIHKCLACRSQLESLVQIHVDFGEHA